MGKDLILFIICDSEINLEGVKAIVSKDCSINIGGSTLSVDEAVIRISTIKPNVVLLCICENNVGRMLEFINQIKRFCAEVRIVVLLHSSNREVILKVIPSGVHAILGRDACCTELLHAIHTINDGGGLLLGSTLPLEDLLRTYGSVGNLEVQKPYGLTPRELKVLELLAKGNAVKTIAEKLNMSTSTVETYKERIKSRLGADSIIEVVAFAVRNGIVTSLIYIGIFAATIIR